MYKSNENDFSKFIKVPSLPCKHPANYDLLGTGFRPSYRFFNKWLSLLGALMCLVIMFLLMWWAALATVIVCAALFLYMKYKKPGQWRKVLSQILPGPKDTSAAIYFQQFATIYFQQFATIYFHNLYFYFSY